MAISYVGLGALASGTTTATCSLPAGWAAGDLAIAISASAEQDMNVPVITSVGGDYEYSGSGTSESGTFGLETGPRRLTFFTHVLADGDGNVTATMPNTPGVAVVVRVMVLRKAATEAWSVTTPEFGEKTTSGTAFSQALTDTPSRMTAGAWLLPFLVLPVTTAQGASAQTLTATGATISALAERADSGTTSGNRVYLIGSTAQVTAGTATAPPVVGATLAAASPGLAGLLVVRATTSALTAQQATTGEVLRVNPVSNPNAESGVTTGWSINTNNATGTVDIVDAEEEGLGLPPSGTGRLVFRGTAPAVSSGGTLGVMGSIPLGIPSGQQVCVSWDMFVPTSNPASEARASFPGGSVSLVSPVALVKGAWRRYYVGTTLTGATSTVQVKSEGGAQAGTDVYVDNVMVEVGTLTPGGYFDGDSSSERLVHRWAGTPRLSESYEYAAYDPPRVGVTLTDWGSDTLTQVYRVHADGSRRDVRGGALLPSGGAAFVWDYEFPTNEEFYYVANDNGTERTTATLDEVIVRRNGNRNPALVNDATDWSAAAASSGTASGARMVGTANGGPTVAGVVRNFYRMSWSAITTGALASTGIVYGSSGTTLIEASPGPWTGSVYWRSNNVNDRTMQAIVTFHDAAGTTLSTAAGTAVLSGGRWVRASVSATAPAGTVRAFVRLYAVGGAAWTTAMTIDATAWLTEDDVATVGPYFDGDTPGTGYRWQGTASLSYSEQVVTDVPTPMVVVDSRSFLRSPGLPALDTAVRVGRVPAANRARPVNYLAPIGRRTLVPQAGARQAPMYALDLVTLTDAEAEALLALMDGTPIAYLLFPGTRYHGTYVSLGDLQENPNGTIGPQEERWQAQATEVSRPAGGIAYDPTSSWQGLVDTSSTWQAVLNTYPTWLDVLRGPTEQQ